MSNGALFSDYFLTDGIGLTAEWKALSADRIAESKAIIADLVAEFDSRHKPNEPTTETDLIEKLLGLLGWQDWLKQEKANDRGRQDVPDYLLFGTAEAKSSAVRARLASDKFGAGTAILEAKAWDVPLDKAAAHIKLVVLINDWSLRAIAPIEMKTGFGWVQAKPACSLAPFAITPDELGVGWRDGRVCLDLEVHWNGELFGRVNGNEMAFSFPELIAHAARTRELVAGTIIGSGTVANADYTARGSACISERRAIEIIVTGEASTDFMRFGEKVTMEVATTGCVSPFGRIDQIVSRQT